MPVVLRGVGKPRLERGHGLSGVRVSSSGEQIVLLGGLHTLPGIIVIALADSEDQTQVERLACLAFSL